MVFLSVIFMCFGFELLCFVVFRATRFCSRRCRRTNVENMPHFNTFTNLLIYRKKIIYSSKTFSHRQPQWRQWFVTVASSIKWLRTKSISLERFCSQSLSDWWNNVDTDEFVLTTPSARSVLVCFMCFSNFLMCCVCALCCKCLLSLLLTCSHGLTVGMYGGW